MLLSSELVSYVVLVAMTTVHCRITVTKTNNKISKTLPDFWKPTGPDQLFDVKTHNSTKIKARQTRRKTRPSAGSNTEGRSGLTTRRPRPQMRPHPTTPDPSTNQLDELLRSEANFFDKLDRAEKELNVAEMRRDAILKAFQANVTGRFRKWPFPFTESTYVLEYNTLQTDMVKHWKNATRDFTELRRVYVPESRSLHVGEMFTAYRRRGTHFYTVLGIEGWDGNIFEYPEVPYKYKDNPGSSYSAPTCEVETRDPRVLPFTDGESRLDIKPRYQIGRQGEWVVDFPNEPYISAGQDRIHWPYKWREDDPDNATLFLNDLPTFQRKRRGLSTVRMSTKLSTVRMRRKRRRDRNISLLFPYGTRDGNLSFSSRFDVSGLSKVSKGLHFPF